MVASTNYLTRQAVRERIAAETERALVFDIESAILDEGSYTVTAQILRTLSAEQALGGILYQAGQSFVVSSIDNQNARIVVSVAGGAVLNPGRAELWRKPGSVDATNRIIDGAIDRIVQRGYRASANFDDWVYSRGEGVVRIPDYVQSINSIEVYDDPSQFTSSPIMRDDITVLTGKLADLPNNGDYLISGSDVGAGTDLVKFRVQSPVSNQRLFNVVLLTLLPANDMRVRVSDGQTETTLSLYANTRRTVSLRMINGLDAYTTFTISSVDTATEYNLYFGQIALYLNESGRGLQELRKGYDWDIDRGDRTIRLYKSGATRVRVRAYRFPQEVMNDTDLVEVPPNALVRYVASQILLAGLPPRGADTSGISSQFPFTANAGQIDLTQVPVPATSHLVGATSRVVSEDITTRMLGDVFTVGFIAAQGDPHLPTESAELGDTLSVVLPLEARYLSIEWEEGDVVSKILIDDYDQRDAFTITGNRAVSDAPLLARPDATTIDVRLES